MDAVRVDPHSALRPFVPRSKKRKVWLRDRAELMEVVPYSSSLSASVPKTAPARLSLRSRCSSEAFRRSAQNTFGGRGGAAGLFVSVCTSDLEI